LILRRAACGSFVIPAPPEVVGFDWSNTPRNLERGIIGLFQSCKRLPWCSVNRDLTLINSPAKKIA